MLITILIIDLEDNPSSSLPFSKIRDLLYGTRIPSSIVILAIHQVTFLQPHSPIEIARPWLIRSDHIAISIDYGAVIQDIIQILNF